LAWSEYGRHHVLGFPKRNAETRRNPSPETIFKRGLGGESEPALAMFASSRYQRTTLYRNECMSAGRDASTKAGPPKGSLPASYPIVAPDYANVRSGTCEEARPRPETVSDEGRSQELSPVLMTEAGLAVGRGIFIKSPRALTAECQG